jgi:hypothetical protein
MMEFEFISSTGLTRVFFRHALNEATLSDFMSALLWNEPLTK